MTKAKRTQKSHSRWLRFAPAVAGVLVTATAGGAAVYFMAQFMDTPAPQPKKIIQQVKLIRPPPPPPQIERPPEPEQLKEEVKLPESEPTPETPSDQPPPGDLGLDATGVAGGDGFGLVARRGGRDLLASGGNRFAWYGDRIKQDLISFLAEHRDIRSRAYSVNVRLWLDGAGAVTRVSLTSSTGDETLDRELETLLGRMERVAEAPPADLPQPVQVRIVSRL
jgi:protein TonB